ncbi:unnamed protein product [Mesocestoides corti]|uniref:PDZ domain-containing protein n=1 Tax=Mesocestoides corti TaxID=53468 RepID=A0A0R3URD1_MESCO|nr:unnamed protein product [Mesocestoides corti]
MPGQVVTLKLVREDSSTPWGFRLEGGRDMGQPLKIQRVSPGGVAERCGLCSGDLVLRINRSDTLHLTHKEAKMEIIRSSNDLEIAVEREGYVPPLSLTTTSTIIQPMSTRVEESVVRGVMDNGQDRA